MLGRARTARDPQGAGGNGSTVGTKGGCLGGAGEWDPRGKCWFRKGGGVGPREGVEVTLACSCAQQLSSLFPSALVASSSPWSVSTTSTKSPPLSTSPQRPSLLLPRLLARAGREIDVLLPLPGAAPSLWPIRDSPLPNKAISL